MNKAVIVGGSNGIGLSIAVELANKGYFIEVLDICAPMEDIIPNGQYQFRYCNLLDFNESLFEQLAKDTDISFLLITAGFGRVADFEYLHCGEIENLIRVNTIAGIKVIKLFYDRIKSTVPFYCGMMGSIAGLVSSPMFSVYAASKAAICRFIESVNIELEVFGTTNRILNVSPGSIKGTRFNGGDNNLSLTSVLANKIIDQMLSSAVMFIPEYDEVYKSVIARYQADPHEYGLHSYQYKKQSGRALNERRARIGYLSGTFDLFHVGHLNLLRRAKQQCDYLIVGVHPDASHKGKQTFIPFEERKQIVRACKYVDNVVDSCREDSDAWKLWHYTKLFVGSDYKGTERFNRYEEYFKDKDVEIVYFPYTQGTSSTQIRKAIVDKSKGYEKES